MLPFQEVEGEKQDFCETSMRNCLQSIQTKNFGKKTYDLLRWN